MEKTVFTGAIVHRQTLQPPGSRNVQSFQHPQLTSESDTSTCTQPATVKPASSTLVKNDVSEEKMSQPPFAQKSFSSNSSQSVTRSTSPSAISSGHLSEVSSDEENSFHTPPSQSSPSVKRKNDTEDHTSLTMQSAFYPPHNKTINIYFKAVLPTKPWEWNNSSIFIHFVQFGEDVGPGSRTRLQPGSYTHDEPTVHEDLLLVEFVVKMHIDVFSKYNYILYKYAVYSRRMEEVKHPYEYLYGAQIEGVADTRYINRALKIDHNNCFPGG